MGCDIHSMAEIKQARYDGSAGVDEEGMLSGRWTPGSERWVALKGEDAMIFPNTYYNPESTYAPSRERWREEPLDSRNYDLFALLANVRNGYGFAGVPRGNAIPPLDMPRGIPADASYGWLEECDGWGPDFHSHSWFTLAELLVWQEQGRFTPHMVRTGVIAAAVYEEIKANGGEPDGWSGGISGRGIWVLTPEQWDAGERPTGPNVEADAPYLETWRSRPGWDEEAYQNAEAKHYIQYTWESSLKDSVGELEDAIAALKRYADDLPPLSYTTREEDPIEDKPGWRGETIPYENVRIVFAFDN